MDPTSAGCLGAMVPVGLQAKKSQSASASGGNEAGAAMVRLGTDRADPADRLTAVHESMRSGEAALAAMTPTRILARSALGMAPAVLVPMPKLRGVTRPPFS